MCSFETAATGGNVLCEDRHEFPSSLLKQPALMATNPADSSWQITPLKRLVVMYLEV
jgi:hypothetical protein